MIYIENILEGKLEMPLIKSKSKKAIGKNIEIEKKAHPSMPIKQAAAIAYSVQRKTKKKK